MSADYKTLCRACFERAGGDRRIRPMYLEWAEACTSCGGNTRCLYPAGPNPTPPAGSQVRPWY